MTNNTEEGDDHDTNKSNCVGHRNDEMITTEKTTRTTDNESLIHALKSNIGPGMLSLPQAFSNSGLWVGLALTPILGFLCTHCMFILVNCSKSLCKRANVETLSYEETAKSAFQYGPETLKKYAKLAGLTIKVFVVLTTLGICCVYFNFIPQNLKQATDCMTPSGTGISQLGFQAIFIVPILLLCYIPDLKKLAPFSLMASVLLSVATAIVYYYIVKDLPRVHEEVPAFVGWSRMPLYFNSVMYALGGIVIVLPLENDMKHREQFRGPVGVLSTSMSIVVIMYTAMGYFGYLQFGSTSQGSITLNLPATEGLSQAVKVLIAFAVFLTYPLQAYIGLEILTPYATRPFEGKKKIIAEYSLRTSMVLLTFVLAAVIPNIGLFINLIGALTGPTLGLIFPAIIDIVTFWPEKGRYYWILIKNVFTILLGSLVFFTGTISSVRDIIDFFINGDSNPPFQC